MTVTRRVVSGSLAGWSRLGTLFLSQIATVPIYLGHWDVEVYGIWLLLHSASLMFPILDASHHQYLDGEFLKTGDENFGRLNQLFWDAVGVSVFVGGIQFVGVIIALWLLGAGVVSGENNAIISQNYLAIAVFGGVYAFLWWCLGSVGGILVRFLYPFGFYPRVAWWFVAITLLESFLPAIVVMVGGDLLAAVLTFLVTFVAIRGALLIDAARIAMRLGLVPVTIDWRSGWGRFAHSLVLALQQFSDALRQQGMRLLLAPLAGTVEMTNFSTIRVGVNAVSQGLTAVSSPLMPEVMRFARARDQQRLDLAFASLWSVVLFAVIPAVAVLQLNGGWLFELWTNSRLKFDPVVFAWLSWSMLLFAIAQPAWALVRANNLLKPQLAISVIATTVLVVGLFMAVPRYGIQGSAFVSLLTEFFCCAATVVVASHWMTRHELSFPKSQFVALLAAACLAGLGMVLSAFLVASQVWILAFVIPVYVGLMWVYWSCLPALGKLRMKQWLQMGLQKVSGSIGKGTR